MPDGRKDDFSIESTAPEFATVTDEGVITALKVGEAEIRATNGGETAVCKVTVCARPTAIELNQTEKRLVVGESFQLGATLQPEGAASALIYRTANPEVAQVSPRRHRDRGWLWRDDDYRRNLRQRGLRGVQGHGGL